MLRATVSTDERKTINKLKKMGFVDPSKGKGSGKAITLIRVVSISDDMLELIKKEIGPAVTFNRT